MIKVSRHAERRMRERCGYGKKTCQRMAERAFQNGITADSATGKLKSYMDDLFEYNRTGNNIRIYGEHIYIFCDSSLITVMSLPAEYKKIVKKKIKKERQNSL